MDAEVYESLYGRLSDKLLGWAMDFVDLLPNAAVALTVLFAFWVLARLSGLVARRALQRMNADDAAIRLLDALVRLTVFGAGLFVALGLLHLDKALASLLAGAGIAGLALGFAFQDLAANLISGVGLAVRREHPFRTGDFIETNEFIGIVRQTDLRTSTLETLDGRLVVIPNKQVYQGVVVNHSASGRRRVELRVGVSYAEDLEDVTAVTRSAITKLEHRAQDPVDVFFDRFADSSIELVAYYWVDYASEADYLKARHAGVLAIRRAYREAGVTIPFPIRTLDFGIKGGEKLSEVLPGSAGAPRLSKAPV